MFELSARDVENLISALNCQMDEFEGVISDAEYRELEALRDRLLVCGINMARQAPGCFDNDCQ